MLASVAVPVMVAVLFTTVAGFTVPAGLLCTVTDWQPTCASLPASRLVTSAHSWWAPSGSATSERKPWFGPNAG